MPSSQSETRPCGWYGKQLQGALLVSLLRGLAERDQDRDPADEDVQDAARSAKTLKQATWPAPAPPDWLFGWRALPCRTHER